TLYPSHVVSSLPLRTTVGLAEPPASRSVQEAAQGLRYRDFLTVSLVIDGEDLFPDNWIYIHDPNVRVGRIQNFRSWSPWMVPNLIPVGRNGLHRYNNSDHSMLTSMRAVDNLLLGTQHDIWAVNAESVYHEEDTPDEQPYKNAPETEAMKQPLAQDR